jgi:glycosyltransferase involved in cell wall biosynthesis
MKKTLYVELEEFPADTEQAKTGEAGGETVWGSNVYVATAFNALLEYSTYDKIVLSGPWGDVEPLLSSPALAANASRVRFLHEHELRELEDEKHLVFASFGPFISELDRLRRRANTPRAPLSGVVHSNNHAFALHAILLALIGDLQRFDSIFCSSRAGQETILKLHRRLQERLKGLTEVHVQEPRMPVVPIGVAAQSFVLKDSSEDRARIRQEMDLQSGVVLLYFGRFDAISKCDLFPLLIAFREICRRHPDSWLVLAGDDSRHHLTEQFSSFADSLGIGGRLRVVPNPSPARKKELYGAADIFVSLSDNLQETFGITVIEAMAAGLPVIASDWDGYRDTVVPDQTGILVPTTVPRLETPYDPIRGLAGMNADLLAASTVVDLPSLIHAACALIGDPDLRRRMGQQARRRAQTLYDWKAVIHCYEEIWDQSVQESRRDDNVVRKPGPQLTQNDYVELFGHYPSSFLDPATRLELSAIVLESPLHAALRGRFVSRGTWFTEASFDQVAEFLKARGTSSVAELAERLSSLGGDSNSAVSSIARMWKYGCLQIATTHRPS